MLLVELHMDYIAAANPTAILALLDVAEFAGYVVAQADGKEWYETGGPDVAALRDALARLHASE